MAQRLSLRAPRLFATAMPEASSLDFPWFQPPSAPKNPSVARIREGAFEISRRATPRRPNGRRGTSPGELPWSAALRGHPSNRRTDRRPRQRRAPRSRGRAYIQAPSPVRSRRPTRRSCTRTPSACCKPWQPQARTRQSGSMRHPPRSSRWEHRYPDTKRSRLRSRHPRSRRRWPVRCRSKIHKLRPRRACRSRWLRARRETKACLSRSIRAATGEPGGDN